MNIKVDIRWLNLSRKGDKEMLALTRKKDEGIIINGNIEVRILDIQDGKVKLGISAPKDVSIHREEVYLEIEKSNKEALESNQDVLKGLLEMLKK